jgi:hypothetical protein
LPAALVLSATVADSLARPGLAFYALLAAVPFAAIAALSALGAVLDRSSEARDEALGGLQTLLWTAALGLIVAATSARSGVLDGAPAAGYAEPALLACVGALALESLVAAVAYARRPVLAGLAVVDGVGALERAQPADERSAGIAA